MAPSSTEKKRHVRTPAEIAQAELEAADARVKKAADKASALAAELEKAKADEARARKVRDHAATHPDLPEQSEDNLDMPAPLT